MPIEIKELHIKITVDESGNTSTKPAGNEGKEELVSKCVEQVMEILREQKER
ncbi:hypothetical protein GCM10007049_07500 [Echinicola pacifica]|uniref:Uncharacterized protein n=1 Tax=Echinicola pacifica TaxID=346377 RepID=A0A918PNL6_9BACT|nr:DUF5908 family protein [Echinicola pacifica]GGZ17468.1 hypothetical protein GCM10007049_07500 [Echinicola pacifica]